MSLFIPTLIVVDWFLWSVLLVALLYACVTLVATRQTPAARPSALSAVLLGFGLLFVAALGLLLHWLAQSQTLTGLAVLTVLLAWPLSSVLTPLATRWLRARRLGSPGSENVAR